MNFYLISEIVKLNGLQKIASKDFFNTTQENVRKGVHANFCRPLLLRNKKKQIRMSDDKSGQYSVQFKILIAHKLIIISHNQCFVIYFDWFLHNFLTKSRCWKLKTFNRYLLNPVLFCSGLCKRKPNTSGSFRLEMGKHWSDRTATRQVFFEFL